MVFFYCPVLASCPVKVDWVLADCLLAPHLYGLVYFLFSSKPIFSTIPVVEIIFPVV